MNVIWSIKNISISAFLSPELLIILLSVFLRKYLDFQIFIDISKFFFFNNEIVTSFTLIIPATLFGVAIKLQSNLLRPHEKNKELILFPLYKEFKLTTFIGLFYSALPIIPTFISVINKELYNESDLGYYYLCLLLVSSVSIVTMYLAKFRINEILDVYLVEKK